MHLVQSGCCLLFPFPASSRTRVSRPGGMAVRLLRSSVMCHRCIARFLSNKSGKNEEDMSYQELAQRRIVPGFDASSLKPAFDPEVDTSKKTTITVINNKKDEGDLFVNAYSQIGFTLSNNISVVGPLALFSRTMFSWRVPPNSKDLKVDAFALFYLLDPKLDVLVIGVGDRGREINLDVIRHLMSVRGIGLEILPTDHAVATFNFLNDEGRNVAGAFYPPQNVVFTEGELHAMFQKKSLEGDEDVDFSALGTNLGKKK